MTEQERNNREITLASAEDIIAVGVFTFGGNKDCRIEFKHIAPIIDEGDTGQVEITVSYPFDRNMFEDVREVLRMPRAEFDRVVLAIVGGDSHASFSAGHDLFELHKEESGRIGFRFASEGYKLEAQCIIDGLIV